MTLWLHSRQNLEAVVEDSLSSSLKISLELDW